MTVAQTTKQANATLPSVLVVDDERDLLELVEDAMARHVQCRLMTAGNVREAKRILQTGPIDLLIVDMNLPDGSGADLLTALRKHHPFATAIVITGSPSVDSAVDALRQGAVDFLTKPFTVEEFLKRTRSALARQSAVKRSEERIDRLRSAVRRLNDARRRVTRKVDLLCNDLVSAYGDLSRQLDSVRTTESFRTAIASTDNLEQMLCHAMDWILREMGYANVAIWLSGEGDYQLGAYMKYTIPSDDVLTEAMRRGLVPMVARDGLLRLTEAEARQKLTGEELRMLKDQAVLGSSCTYLGESLAQIILFRDGGKPFSEEDATMLSAICPVFAITLASLVRRNDEEDEDRDSEEYRSEGGSMMDDDPESKSRKRKDEADWWKHGEEPPF